MKNLNKYFILPIKGMEADAGGVDSFRSRSKTKKATNMFIPEKLKKRSYMKVRRSFHYSMCDKTPKT